VRDDGRDLCNDLGREGIGAHAVERACLGVEDWLLSKRRRSRFELLAGNGGLETELQFRFGGTKECLVDLGLVGVEGNVGAGAIGIALEDNVIFGADLEESSELQQDKQISTWPVCYGYGEYMAGDRLPPAHPGLTERSCTHLVWKHLGTEVAQWDLELLAEALELDLDDYGSVERHWHVGSHGGRRVRLTGYCDVVSVGAGWDAAQSRRRDGSEGDGLLRKGASRIIWRRVGGGEGGGGGRERWMEMEVEMEMG
jgi:hypothetical protein